MRTSARLSTTVPTAASVTIVFLLRPARLPSLPKRLGLKEESRHCPIGAIGRAACDGPPPPNYRRPAELSPIPFPRMPAGSISETGRPLDSLNPGPDPFFLDAPS